MRDPRSKRQIPQELHPYTLLASSSPKPFTPAPGFGLTISNAAGFDTANVVIADPFAIANTSSCWSDIKYENRNLFNAFSQNADRGFALSYGHRDCLLHLHHLGLLPETPPSATTMGRRRSWSDPSCDPLEPPTPRTLPNGVATTAKALTGGANCTSQVRGCERSSGTPYR